MPHRVIKGPPRWLTCGPTRQAGRHATAGMSTVSTAATVALGSPASVLLRHPVCDAHLDPFFLVLSAVQCSMHTLAFSPSQHASACSLECRGARCGFILRRCGVRGRISCRRPTNPVSATLVGPRVLGHRRPALRSARAHFERARGDKQGGSARCRRRSDPRLGAGPSKCLIERRARAQRRAVTVCPAPPPQRRPRASPDNSSTIAR